ncbi:MAG: IS21-like element helper ATPase IstB [Chloroflexota bacterium]
MNPVERLKNDLSGLGLKDAADALDQVLDSASKTKLPYADFLIELLARELAVRRERYLKARTRLAHLPFHKRLEDFDFSYQPSLDEGQIRELATLSFAEQAHNVILLGPPGVGKTHIAVALGLKGVENGMGVYFVTAQALTEDLRQAHAENRLERRLRVYLAPKILIVDEVGYLPFDALGATMLFQLVSARYERGSVILTSNKGFAQWGEVFPDPIIATAILDRLLHHSHVINIRGDSYRLKDKRRAGFIASPFGQKDRSAAQ